MKNQIGSVGELNRALATCRVSKETKNTIELAPGDYLLSEPIMLDERDSGLTLAGSGSTTLYGGCRVSGWRRDGDRFRVDVPTGAEPRLLIVDGAFRDRSRFPAEGMLENKNTPEDLRWMSSTGGGWNRPLTHDELTRMTVNPDDLPPGMDLTNAEITVYHKWDESTVRVKSYDAANGLVEFLTETAHPAGAFQNHGYTVWNTKEGLTRPGQWYFDRSLGQVVYLPLDGEDPDTLDAWIPLTEHVILCENCRDIEIRDLRIRLCHAPAEVVGLRAINAPGAIEARKAEGLRLASLDISHVTGNGIRLMGCKNLNVDHCQVREAGAGGIFTHECENEIITHNTVAGIGRTTFSAIGIHCGWKSMLVYVQDGYPEEKGTVLLAHNTISDVPYCGITCNGGPHRVEYNRLSNCMTVLQDGAAIYCSRADRTILRGNYVFDIDGELGYAYYFDEQSRHSALEANIAVNVPTPILFHMSEDISICRNVFLSDKGCVINMARSRYTTWRHNIVACEGKLAFAHRGWDYRQSAMPLHDVFAFIHCLAYSRSGEYELMGADQPPSDGNLICADPLLEIDGDGRISIAENSPVKQINFTLPDGRSAGVDAPDPGPEMVKRQ